jgi:hypothetical protein
MTHIVLQRQVSHTFEETLGASPDVGVPHKVHGCERVDSTWHTAFSKDRFPTLLE